MKLPTQKGGEIGALAPPSRARAPALRRVRSLSFARLLAASCAGSWPPCRRPSRGRRVSLRSLSPPPSLAPRLPSTPALRASPCPAPLGFGVRSRCARGRGGSALASHTSPALRIAPLPPNPRSLLPARLPRPPVRARPPSAPSARGLRVVPPRRPRATSAPRASPFPAVSSCSRPSCTVQSSCHRCSRASRACFPGSRSFPLAIDAAALRAPASVRALNIVKYCRCPLRPFRGSARGIPCRNISSAGIRKIRGSAASLRPLHGLSHPSPIHRR